MIILYGVLTVCVFCNLLHKIVINNKYQYNYKYVYSTCRTISKNNTDFSKIALLLHTRLELDLTDIRNDNVKNPITFK